MDSFVDIADQRTSAFRLVGENSCTGRTRAVIFDCHDRRNRHCPQLTVVTRNVRDFEQFGVTILNPFENP